MIALDSPTWDQLRHCYGPASDIPNLLRQLAANPQPMKGDDDGPWESLWSALCHQGDVYPASYAAVPHIVQIALDAKGPVHFSFFLLPACVEVARKRKRGPDIPQELEWDYFAALRKMIECAARHAAGDWDISMLLSVLAAIAAAKDQPNLADLLTELPSSIIERLDEDMIAKITDFAESQ
jgi:hypothetical protein